MTGLSAYVNRIWVAGFACEYLERTILWDLALGCLTPGRGGAGGSWLGNWMVLAGVKRVAAGSAGRGGGVRWRGFLPPKARSSRRLVCRGVSLRESLGAGST